MPKTVHILGEGGAVFELALPLSEPIEDRLLKGYLKLVTADGTPVKEKSARVRPKTTDSKAEWVGWAVHISQSTESPITPDDADALTKQDLIEAYGVK
jgi:hypothetical protein